MLSTIVLPLIVFQTRKKGKNEAKKRNISAVCSQGVTSRYRLSGQLHRHSLSCATTVTARQLSSGAGVVGLVSVSMCRFLSLAAMLACATTFATRRWWFCDHCRHMPPVTFSLGLRPFLGTNPICVFTSWMCDKSYIDTTHSPINPHFSLVVGVDRWRWFGVSIIVTTPRTLIAEHGADRPVPSVSGRQWTPLGARAQLRRRPLVYRFPCSRWGAPSVPAASSRPTPRHPGGGCTHSWARSRCRQCRRRRTTCAARSSADRPASEWCGTGDAPLEEGGGAILEITDETCTPNAYDALLLAW